MNIEQARFNMVEQQIRPWNVSDPSVLELLSSVKREDFAPAAHKGLAFADLEIPLLGSRCLMSRSQKNASRVGAKAVMTGPPQLLRDGPLPTREVRGWPPNTSTSKPG